MDSSPFTPGATVNLVSTASSGAVALPKSSNQQLLVTNVSSVLIFVELGISTVTATTTASMPIPPTSSRIITVGPGATHVAAISASTATCYFTGGHGA